MLTSLEPAELKGCGCDGYAQLETNIEARLREVELVAVDMDGTLLTDDKRVTAASREAIDRALAAGVRVVPASGRVVSVLPNELFEIDGIEHAVCCAGASIEKLGAQPGTSETLHATGFSPDGAAGIAAMLVEQFGTDIFVDVANGGDVYTSRDQLDLLPAFDLTGLSLPYILKSRIVLSDLVEGIRELSGVVGRVNIFGRNDAVLREVMAWLAKNTPYELANSLEHNVEINAPGTSKWNGLTWLCEYLGIRPDRVMAIGDGANDVDMVRHAWLGVSMRNGTSDLKANAAAVTRYTNEENGVARVLNELIALKQSC